MAQDNQIQPTNPNTAAQTDEERYVEIENINEEIKNLLKELRRAASDVEDTGRAYDKIKKKADAKPNTRNSAKLTAVREELRSAVSNMRSIEAKIRKMLERIAAIYTKLSDNAYLRGERSKAKKLSRTSEKFVRKIEKQIDEYVMAVEVYLSVLPVENREVADATAPQERPQPRPTPQYPQSTYPQYREGAYPQYPQPPVPQAQPGAVPPFYFVPAYAQAPAPQPVAQPAAQEIFSPDEMNSIVKAALDAAIAPYIKEIEEKIAECMNSITLLANNTAPGVVSEPTVEASAEPVTEEPAAPVVDDTPVVEETAVVEEAPLVEEIPVVEETPIVEQVPLVEEAITTEEIPPVEEPIVAEETASSVDTDDVIAGGEENAALLDSAEEIVDAASVEARFGDIYSVVNRIISEAEAIANRASEIANSQSSVLEIQRKLTREMQGIQVKQRLISDEQAAIVEAQETVVQRQKLIAERQGEILDNQNTTVEAIEAIMEAQTSVDNSVRGSIQTQKTIIQSNSKLLEIQSELIERQTTLAEEQKEAINAQRKLLRRAGKRKPEEAPEETEE